MVKHDKQSDSCIRFVVHQSHHMAAKKQSIREDQPLVRISREREYIDSLKHENETLKLDLNRESRDAKKATNQFIASDISRQRLK